MEKKPFLIQLIGICTGFSLQDIHMLASILVLCLTALYTGIKIYQALKKGK